MKVKVELDQDCVEPIILIKTKEITNEINELIQFLNSKQYEMIAGFYNDTVELLEQSQIIRFYASQQKVYAQVNDREYVIRLRLYEIENRLNQKRLYSNFTFRNC